MAAAQEGTSTPRKLGELRVVDLKGELEKRGLEKTGVKAALIDRLKKALEDEGKNPEEFMFEIGAAAGTKKITSTPNKSESEDMDAEEIEIEPLISENKADVIENKVENNISSEEAPTKEEVNSKEEPIIEDKTVEEMKVDETLDDAISISFEDEEKLLAEDEDITMKTDKEPENINHAETSSDKPGDSTPVDHPAAKSKQGGLSLPSGVTVSEPPSPGSVPPILPFTLEDTIRLDTSVEKKSEEDISMIVHVDESQDDLDADLVTPKKGTKEPASATPTVVKTETTDTKPAITTVKTEPADSAEPKVTPTEGKKEPANGVAEAKADKPVTDAIKKEEEKKVETSSDVIKETSISSVEKKDTKEAEKKDVKDKVKPEVKKTTVANSRNLWVSGLSSSTRATDLKALFSKHGKVAGAKVVTNARSPGSRCYGFVTMSTAEEASKCIQHLHRTELHGRMISVERAKNDPSPVKPTSKKPADSKTSGTPKTTDKKDGTKKEPVTKDGEKKEEKKDEKKPAVGHLRARTASGGIPKKEGHLRPPPRERHQSDRSHSRTKSKEPIKAEDKRPSPDKSGSPKKDGDGKDVLSFDKIKEERERERLRQKERQLREKERKRMRELEHQRQRQRDVERRQREEAMRLEREKERLRLEKARLEREKLEAERERIAFERERQKRERERLEREREEERRREEQIRLDEQRRATKRPFDARGGRDESMETWGSANKRPAVGENRNFENRRTFTNANANQTRNENFPGRRVERYNPREEQQQDTSRTRDRSFEDRNRRTSGREENPRDTRTRTTVTADTRYNTRNTEDRSGREGSRERRSDRDSVGRRSNDRLRLSPHNTRTNQRDPPRRDTRTEWKQDTRTNQPAHRDSRDSRGPGTQDRGGYSDRGPSSRDVGWQGGQHSSNVVDDRNKRNTGYQPNPGPGLLGTGGFPAGADWDSRTPAQTTTVRPGDRQWPATGQVGQIRTQGALISNQPLIQHPPGTTGQFIAAAANIMAGVGMANNRDKVPRYDAYSQMQGNVRRY